MTPQVTPEEITRMRDLALKIHELGKQIEHPADLLFALAVETAGEICTHFPRAQWGRLIHDHAKLIAKMAGEYAFITSTVPEKQN